MQPATGADKITLPYRPISAGDQPALASGLNARLLRRADLLNLALLLVGFALVLLIVPPARSFPTDDDWAYARSVQDLLHGIYRVPLAQATALGHTAWGALFVSAFGFSFTTLSASTLLMSAICLVLFYVLIRHLNISSRYALFGAALLGCSPIFVYLGYSFMTDVTFLTYTLGACLCLVRGAQGYGTRWFWLGGSISALAYLTRQFALVLVVAALLYLWWSGKWEWRKALGVTLLPALTAAAYMMWERTQPVSLSTYGVNTMRAEGMRDIVQFALDRAQSLALVVVTPGLCLLPLLRVPRRILWMLPVFGYVVLFELRSSQLFGSAFPVNGDIVDNTGFYTCCNMAPVWSPNVWLVIGVVAAAALSLYLVMLVEWVWGWLREHGIRSAVSDPAFMLYIYGLLMAGAVIAFGFYSVLLYDRYFLPVLLVLMLPALRRMSANDLLPVVSRERWRWLALLPIAAFAVAGQHDYLARASARWQGAQQLLAQGIPADKIYAGFEWQGWYLYDEGERYIREKGDFQHVIYPPAAVNDPVYAVMQLTGGEYSEIGSLPYTSWLQGGSTQRMLLLKRK